MKYVFGTIVLVTALFLSTVSLTFAQSASCDNGIDASNYQDCCLSPVPQGDINACRSYAAAQQVKDTNNQCSDINTQARYDACCTSPNDSAQCAGYYASTEHSVPGVIGSMTAISTNAVNDGTSASYGSTAATGTTADQALATCSAIQFKTLLDIAIWAKCIIGGIVIPGIFTLAFVVFLWGVFKFIRSSEQKDKQESKQFIYMGLIGLFVMTSVWGIIKILGTTLGIDSTVPALQTTTLDINNASKK